MVPRTHWNSGLAGCKCKHPKAETFEGKDRTNLNILFGVGDFEKYCRDWRTWRLYKVTGQDFFFVSTVLLSTIILLFLLSSSVSLSYINMDVPMRKCLGKHSCMSSPFFIAILNGTCYLRWWCACWQLCGDVPARKQLNYIHTMSYIFGVHFSYSLKFVRVI